MYGPGPHCGCLEMRIRYGKILTPGHGPVFTCQVAPTRFGWMNPEGLQSQFRQCRQWSRFRNSSPGPWW